MAVVSPACSAEPTHSQAAFLRGQLEALAALTGASAGWIGVSDDRGRLTFPAQVGAISETVLTLLHGVGGWGVVISDQLTLLNDFEAPAPHETALQNLLTCPLLGGASPRGHLVLANKPNGFTSHDATALQTAAHLLGTHLGRAPPAAAQADAAWLRLALDRVPQGVLLVDAADGTLLHANAPWCKWTGFSPQELTQHEPPYPFWVTPQDLVAAGPWSLPQRDRKPGSMCLPFRQRDRGVFWCSVACSTEELAGRTVHVAVLHRLPAPAPGLRPPTSQAAAGLSEAGTAFSFQAAATTPFPPDLDWLGLLLIPGDDIESWNERWERLTGLTVDDWATVPVGRRADWLLDQMFPRQVDRDFVADLLNQLTRRSAQRILQVMSRDNGSRPMLCTFLPLGGAGPDRWLFLAGEAGAFPGIETPAQRFLTQFLSGLSHLLNNYLLGAVGSAEQALDRGDLPGELTESFNQVVEHCSHAGQVVAALGLLALTAPRNPEVVELARLVRQCLAEFGGSEEPRPYELHSELRAEETPVRVDPALLRIVLRHLLSNAVDAVRNQPRRHITVRVNVQDREVHCAIHHTGVGLSTNHWPLLLAPFHLTQEPAAGRPEQTQVHAAGLGLTISQHLLALHHGRLELSEGPGEGATAALVLPRDLAPEESTRNPRHEDAPLERARPTPPTG